MIGEDMMVPSTEADQLRQQLLQAQRLSSVGALASSVAHEFNNILTTIINYAKLGLRPNCDEPGRLQALEKILKGSQRAATIINSMLGFARNHTTQREVTALVELVEEVLLLTEKDLSKHRVHVEKTFQGRPQVQHYNPMGSVHGGWIATLLDSALACAVHTLLPVGKSYTTVELKVNYVKALTDLAIQTATKLGPVTVDMGATACKVPSAVEYIRKVQDRGAVGKKRKTVKC